MSLRWNSFQVSNVDGWAPFWDNGYPLQGYDEVPGKFHNDRLVLDQVIAEPEPISFDKALWDECQSEHIYMTDSTNKISFPREIHGRLISKEAEKQLQEQIYLQRVLSKNKLC